MGQPGRFAVVHLGGVDETPAGIDGEIVEQPGNGPGPQPGFDLRNLAYLLRAGFDVTATDRDPNAVAGTSALFRELAPGLGPDEAQPSPSESPWKYWMRIWGWGNLPA